MNCGSGPFYPAMGGRLGSVYAAFLFVMLAAACSATPSARGTTPPASGGQVAVASPTANQPPTPSAIPSSSASPSTSPSASPSPVVHYTSRCAVSQLTLAWGGPTSEATGQHTLPLVLTNTSRTGCHLFGYPGISLIDANGRILPLQYVWGGDQMVTSSPPVMVEIAPAASAYIVTNKYRCDTSDYMHAVKARVIPPDDTAFLQVSLVNNVPMDYCGQGDPGSILHISPVEPSFQAASTY